MAKKDDKKIQWVGSSLDDLREFPEAVKDDVGHALREAQQGKKPGLAKPLKGHKGASVLEIVDVYDTDTYRSVYTVKFKDILYVLHCFKKKSKKGIATPKQDIKLINERLKDAKSHYESNYGKE